MGDVEFAVLVTRLEDDAYDLGEVGCSNAREIETLGQRIDETKVAMFAHVDSLRAAVRAADAFLEFIKEEACADWHVAHAYREARERLGPAPEGTDPVTLPTHGGSSCDPEHSMATLTRERDEARAEVLRTIRELNDSRAETEQAAASERAAIVAMLHNEAFRLSAQADVTDDGYDANTMDDQARALRAAAERIERGKGDV